ncbi:putative 40S ribosomal protein S9-2-like [Capsicum annuum]|nr:putative 40S ribosomal protein S9-2-like [Capsicum annuum]
MPAAFVKEHKKMLAKTCLVKTDEGFSWEVKLVKETSHYFICEEGWSRFVMHHKLELGDMLIFFLVEKSTFYVLPYSKKSVTNVRHFEELSSSDEENIQIGPSRISKKVKTESIESLVPETKEGKKVFMEVIELSDSEEENVDPSSSSKNGGNSCYSHPDDICCGVDSDGGKGERIKIGNSYVERENNGESERGGNGSDSGGRGGGGCGRQQKGCGGGVVVMV